MARTREGRFTIQVGNGRGEFALTTGTVTCDHPGCNRLGTWAVGRFWVERSGKSGCSLELYCLHHITADDLRGADSLPLKGDRDQKEIQESTEAGGDREL